MRLLHQLKKSEVNASKTPSKHFFIIRLIFLSNVTISAWPNSVHSRTLSRVKIPLKVLFGQRLRELRRERGMSQEAFADHCGYARSYMSRLERGAGNPSLEAIEILASALSVEVVELFSLHPS
jgi:DNA-binding XRE family transcriptional regulator